MSGPPRAPGQMTPDEQMENLRAVASHLAERSRKPTLDERLARPESEAQVRRKLGGLGSLGLLLAFVLTKGKVLVGLAKFLPTFGSGLVSLVVYAQAWGWPFAAGFVALIFVHELGHYVVMRALGVPAGAPVFVPFFGAVIAMRGMPRNAWIEALVGIGGPVLGTFGALALLPFAGASPLLASLAATGLWINLFNLLPVSPLDGGRVAGAISRWLWIAGLLMAGAGYAATRSPMLALVVIFGGITLFQRLSRPVPGYHDISLVKRLVMALLYFGLIAGILLALALVPRGPHDLEALVLYGIAAHLLPASRAASRRGPAML